MDAPRPPAWRTALAAWRGVLGNFGAYLRLSWLPFALVLAANAAMALTGFGGAPAGPAADFPELLRHLLGIFAEWAVWFAMIPVATAWSRHAASGAAPAFALGRAERDYLWRYLAFVLLLFSTATVPGRLTYGLGHELRAAIGFYPMFVAQAAIYPVFLAGLVAVMRFALILPAAAIGRPLRLRDSWALVRANEPAVAGALILASLPVVPVQFAVALAMDGVTASGVAGALVVALHKTFALWLVWPVWAGVLVLLHARLTTAHPPAEAAAAGDPATERVQRPAADGLT